MGESDPIPSSWKYLHFQPNVRDVFPIKNPAGSVHYQQQQRFLWNKKEERNNWVLQTLKQYVATQYKPPQYHTAT